MLIDTEKEHGRPPVRKSECDSPEIGKSHLPLKATLSSISKGVWHSWPVWRSRRRLSGNNIRSHKTSLYEPPCTSKLNPPVNNNQSQRNDGRLAMIGLLRISTTTVCHCRQTIDYLLNSIDSVCHLHSIYQTTYKDCCFEGIVRIRHEKFRGFSGSVRFGNDQL